MQVQFIPAPPAPFMQVTVLPQIPLPQPFMQYAVMPAQPSNVVIVPPQLHSPAPIKLSPGLNPITLPVILVVQCVLPFLDYCQVLYTTKLFYTYRTFNQKILEWHLAYVKTLHKGFAPDPAVRLFVHLLGDCLSGFGDCHVSLLFKKTASNV